jgi:hypothetical protein
MLEYDLPVDDQLKRTLNEEAWMRSVCSTATELKPGLSGFPPIF